MPFRSISRLAFVVASVAAVAGCGSADRQSENISTQRAAFVDDPGAGPNICDPAYWNEYAIDVALWCEEGEDSEQKGDTYTLCYDAAYKIAQDWCEQAKRAREFEKQLCESGRADPTTCPPSWLPGGGGGTTPPPSGSPSGGGGGSCSWCDCYGEYYDYHGSVCGQTSTELVDECWGSCA